MNNFDILFSKFSGPAAIRLVENDKISTANINSKFLPEMKLELTEEAYLSSDFRKEFDDADWDLYQSAIKRCLSGEENVTIETKRFFPESYTSDTHSHIQSSFILMDPIDGTPCVFESIKNITESHHKLELDDNIIEALAEEYKGIALLDLTSKTVRILRTDEMLGGQKDIDYPFDRYINAISKFLKTDMGDILENIMNAPYLESEAFKDGTRKEYTIRSVNAVWIRIKAQAIEIVDDRVTKILLAATIIDRNQAQKFENDYLVIKQKEQLEQRQEQLLAAIDEANKANEAKTRFFSNMSHDIRTPMNAIMGFLKLAQEEIDNTEQVKNYLDKISSSSDHLLSLINDILDMSRIESGKMHLSTEPANLCDLCDETYQILKNQMDEKHIKFTLDYSKVKTPNIYCDKLRVRQIFLNLLSNAYKFTPEKGKVAFTVSQLEKENTYIISVKDNGIGISEDYQKEIFEPFTREKGMKVSEIQGTGLGMSIVKNIVNIMKGTIEVKSKLGKGTEFIIIVPFEPCDNLVEPVKEKVSTVLDMDFTGKTIFLVDDTPINRTVAKRMLTKSGFNVLEAGNGFDAVTFVENSNEGDIDLILMDVMMPIMDGLEATRMIKSLEKSYHRAIPIIAMTANAFKEDIDAAKAAGMCEHIAKPFVKEDLLERIALHLQ